MQKNLFGYPIINRERMADFFGDNTPKMSPTLQRKTEKELTDLSIPLPVDYDDGLVDYSIPTPALPGDNIYEQFENIASEFVGHSVDCLDLFSKVDIPEVPAKLFTDKDGKFYFNGQIITPGWTRIEFSTNVLTKVDNPLEETFVFDTETFVKGGNYPIMATAVSDKAYYLWLADECLFPEMDNSSWVQRDMVSVGRGKNILAHNSDFDRVRSKEAYDFTVDNENFWYDTMSFHVATSGLASGQRYFYQLMKKDKTELTTKEQKLVKYKPSWADKGSNNSLVDCYNYHVAEWTSHPKLTLTDKKVRDLFVKANSMKEIRKDLRKLSIYALKDTYYTFLLFKYLWPRYRDCTPSLTAIAGHVKLLGSKIPVKDDWHQWIENCEAIYHKHLEETSAIIKKICTDLYHRWLPLFMEDLETLHPKIKEFGYDILLDGADEDNALKFYNSKPECSGFWWDNKKKGWKSSLVRYPDKKWKPPNENQLVLWFSTMEPSWCEKTYKLWSQDVWYSQLDWTPCKYLGEWIPMWYKPWIKEPDYQVTNKSRVMHTLLKLTWRGYPVIHTVDNGFCFRVPPDEGDTLDEPVVMETADGFDLHKIPHKDGYKNNVGVLLSKDYLTYYEANIMSGAEEKAGRVLEIGVITSYWTSIRSRVKKRFVKKSNNPLGDDVLITLPEISPHGTVK